jgi:hypothetical protein
MRRCSILARVALHLADGDRRSHRGRRSRINVVGKGCARACSGCRWAEREARRGLTGGDTVDWACWSCSFSRLTGELVDAGLSQSAPTCPKVVHRTRLPVAPSSAPSQLPRSLHIHSQFTYKLAGQSSPLYSLLHQNWRLLLCLHNLCCELVHPPSRSTSATPAMDLRKGRHAVTWNITDIGKLA